MHEKYAKIGTTEDKAIEECAELIKAVMKARRFGMLNHHPDRPEQTNLQEILGEIEDVLRSVAEYEAELIGKPVKRDDRDDGWVPITYEYMPPGYSGKVVRISRLKPDCFTVRDGFGCLTKRLDWEYEPLSSARPKPFLKRTRLASLEEAKDRANKWLDRQRKEK